MKGLYELERELGVPLAELRRMALDPKAFYVYKTHKKEGKKPRKLRVPRGQLLRIQRVIKSKILDQMPLPSTRHGWRKGHSPKTYVRPHIRRHVVLNLDIQDCFPSITAGRVCAFLEWAGYSGTAAKLLTQLVTMDNQLPQGAPTSSGICNQVLRGADRRLAGMARQHRLNYSNYADEVAVSGGRRVKKVRNLATRIIEQEGFWVNPDKIKTPERHERQELAGIVVNRRQSPGRDRYRLLRAIIHNCIRYGPASQNRENHRDFRGHLEGKVNYFRQINRRLGERLWKDFQRIAWEKTA